MTFVGIFSLVRKEREFKFNQVLLSLKRKETRNNDRYLWYRVVVNVNDLVQVTSDNLSREKKKLNDNRFLLLTGIYTHTDLCNFTQPLEVILPLWSHETVEGEGGKVADCHLSVKVKNKTHSQNTLAPNCLKFVMVHLCVQLAL